jgi:DNA-binding transcriptional MerR regulator
VTQELRIDELARETGLTVDTIRYYQREGLLPAGRRVGRHTVYGEEHLERIARIRELQRRRFSLAAVRALLSDEPDVLVRGIMMPEEPEGQAYDFEDLVAKSGVDRSLAAGLRDAGLLGRPAEFGRDTYDDEDLDLCKAMAALHNLGLPVKVLIAVGRAYAEGIEATQQKVLDVFAGGAELDWQPAELSDFHALLGHVYSQVHAPLRDIVSYTHHRTAQRLSLERSRAAETA